MSAKKPVEKSLTPPAPSAKVEESGKVSEPTMLEKAKLIADLAAAWQNPELSSLIKSLPSGDRLFEIFANAVSREMNTIMTGKREADPGLQALSAQTEQMASAMSEFKGLIVGFMQSPLVQVLDLMNKNLGGRRADFSPPARQQAPVVEDDDVTPQPVGRSGRGAPGLGSF